VFILYALLIGIALGLLLGGRLSALGDLRIRWAWLAIAGLGVQLVLFSPLGERLPDAAVPVAYVASTAAVLAVVLLNWRIPGFAIIALGAGLNLVAILANGGYMPADPAALAAAGLDPGSGATNSIVTDSPALCLLTDIFAIPSALPFANVFSVGDVIIGIGVLVAIVAAMRARPAASQADTA
jgi:hypothetical protein